MSSTAFSKKMTKRDQQSLEKKEFIFSKSMELFRTHGYDTITMQDICEATETSVGSIYNFFGSKLGILMYAGTELLHLGKEDMDADDYNAMLKDPYKELLNAYINIARRFDNEFGKELTRKITECSIQILSNNGVRHVWSKSSYNMEFIHDAQELGTLTKEYPSETIGQFLDAFLEGLIHEWCFHDMEDATLTELVSRLMPIALKNFII